MQKVFCCFVFVTTLCGCLGIHGGRKAQEVTQTECRQVDYDLLVASYLGDLERVKTLLREGADPDGPIDPAMFVNDERRGISFGDYLRDTRTALYAVTVSEKVTNEVLRVSIARELLDNGADINKEGERFQRSALTGALVSNDHVLLGRYLISRGANLNATYAGIDNVSTVLHEAIRKRNADVVLYLVARGASLDITDEEGNTPLVLTIRMGQEGLACALLQGGANPNRTWTERREGKSFSYYDARTGKCVAKVFTQRDRWSEVSPLHLAVMYQEVQVVDVLLRHGADANAVWTEHKSFGAGPDDRIVSIKPIDLIHSRPPATDSSEEAEKKRQIWDMLIKKSTPDRSAKSSNRLF